MSTHFSSALKRSGAKQSGFTLVELAIVLVIIGLLVGGVLVGQDLIKAAEIRATVTQLEQVNAAATTFRTRFNGLPGDLQNQRAQQFSLTARAGTAGRGDGNGAIQGGALAGVGDILGFENTLFWVDLSAADLIPDAFTTGTDAAGANVNTAAGFTALLPNTKIREATYLHVVAIGGRNFLYLAGMTSTDGTGNITAADGLQVIEADSIDEKLDDGQPLTGGTLAVNALTDANLLTGGGNILDAGAAAATTVCVNTTVDPDDYNVQEQFAQEVNCRLLTRTSF